MTDQTQIAPASISLPNLVPTRSKFTVFIRKLKKSSAQLPLSIRNRRDIGLTSEHTRNDVRDHQGNRIWDLS
jgi:hypothetical protein